MVKIERALAILIQWLNSDSEMGSFLAFVNLLSSHNSSSQHFDALVSMSLQNLSSSQHFEAQDLPDLP